MCGEANVVTGYTRRRTSTAVGTQDAGETTTTVENTETWLYYGGTGRLSRLVSIQRGKITDIKEIRIPQVADPIAFQRRLDPGVSVANDGDLFSDAGDSGCDSEEDDSE